MPLSKAKQAQWMREYRKRSRYNVIPKETKPVIPSVPTIDTVSPPVQREGYGKASSTVIPSPYKGMVTDDGELVEFDADGNRIYEEG